MPNHVSNIVKMNGICKLPLFAEEDGKINFDFEKIIPMPEDLQMDSGPLEDIAIEAVMRQMGSRWHFGKIYKTMSDAEYERQRSAYDGDDASLLKIGLQYITNKVLYGATTWYDWRIDNWGTKWNAYENKQDDDNTVRFETAWRAPEKVMLRLSEIYPDAAIEHWWADEDTGNNAGHQVYKAGKIISGGPYTNRSNEAYETYVRCWEESKCVYRDENGNWCRRDCETCDLCD